MWGRGRRNGFFVEQSQLARHLMLEFSESMGEHFANRSIESYFARSDFSEGQHGFFVVGPLDFRWRTFHQLTGACSCQ